MNQKFYRGRIWWILWVTSTRWMSGFGTWIRPVSSFWCRATLLVTCSTISFVLHRRFREVPANSGWKQAKCVHTWFNFLSGSRNPSYRGFALFKGMSVSAFLTEFGSFRHHLNRFVLFLKKVCFLYEILKKKLNETSSSLPRPQMN